VPLQDYCATAIDNIHNEFVKDPILVARGYFAKIMGMDENNGMLYQMMNMTELCLRMIRLLGCEMQPKPWYEKAPTTINRLWK